MNFSVNNERKILYNEHNLLETTKTGRNKETSQYKLVV